MRIIHRLHHYPVREHNPARLQSPAPGFCNPTSSRRLAKQLTPASILPFVTATLSISKTALQNLELLTSGAVLGHHPRSSKSLFRLRGGASAMASQCHRLAVHSPAASLSPPHACSPSSRPNSRLNQSWVFLRGERLQSQRMAMHSLSSTARPVVQCVSSTVGGSSSEELGKSGSDRVQNNAISNVWAKAPEPVRVFPWGKAGRLFVERVVYHFWTVGKWLVIPVLAVSMLSELSYTLLQKKVFIIPAGMIGGFAFAGMLKETAIELTSEFETGETAWHLVALGLFFAALKFIGPYLPGWGRVTVPHFANGGLWHVIKLVNDWRRQHAERTPVKRG